MGVHGPSRRPRQLVVELSLQFRDSRLYPEGLKRGDNAESSVLAAFQLVQSGWGQPGLPGWGSVVDNTEKGALLWVCTRESTQRQRLAAARAEFSVDD